MKTAKSRQTGVALWLVMPAAFCGCGAPAFADVACGPGMRMVGMRTVGGGAPGSPSQSVPACEPEGDGLPAPGIETPEIVLSPLNAAIVWWNDSSGRPNFSYATARLYSSAAVDDAMAHCFLSAGQNCRPGITAAGGWLAVSRSNKGSLFAAYGATRKDASKSALARCAEAESGCREEKRIDNRK